MKSALPWTVLAATLLLPAAALAEIQVATEKSGTMNFTKVPAPSRGDAATRATFTLADGQKDPNSAALSMLHDGRLPRTEDRPSENFFFRAGTDGGRIVADLGEPITISQINTFSFHKDTRGPQVYRLYASVGGEGFDPAPKRGTDPAKAGWTLITAVDTRPKTGEPGGAYGVSVSDSKGPIGKYRYLLWDVSQTESDDPFGNTFYSEFDVVDANAPAAPEITQIPAEKVLEAEGGKYRIVLDTSLAPDLTEWAEKELGPVIQEWYPKIVEMLPSPGFKAPDRVMIAFQDDLGGTPAAAAGNRVMCNIDWFRKNLKGEARGAVVHELVHVVQQYGNARRRNREAKRAPGWVVEGIPDYIRWFLYEPESRGAEITQRNLSRAKYDASYRVTANFLNWVTEQHGKEIIQKVNAAAREGTYDEEIWKKLTGKTVQELDEAWRKQHEEKLKAAAPASGRS